MDHRLDRRDFLAGSALVGAGMSLASSSPVRASAGSAKPALLGGKPVRTAGVPGWPVFDEAEEAGLLKALRSGNWARSNGQVVKQFEASFAEAMGAKYCLATSSGTGALVTSLAAVGVEQGDEVILPPYTFVACANAILQRGALPVFVDIDPETFQIDPQEIEKAISERTTAIMPVHLAGAPANMDAIRAIAERHKIPVVEDACQAHLAEWRGAKLGTLGQAGCFSFQASKNMNSGEGGAIIVNDERLLDRCYAFHYQGTRRAASTRSEDAGFTAGCKFTMTEFQAGVLLAQLSRLDSQARRRSENAEYLSQLLRDIPGIQPARVYDGCTRHAYHIYPLRYTPEPFAGLPRATFLKALSAEGISASSGYTPLSKAPFLKTTLQSRGFRRLFSPERVALWEEQIACPRTDQACAAAVWLSHRYLLGTRQDMEQIAEAVRKIHDHAAELAKV